MDAQILINSIDQTGYLISISRSYNYCNVSQEFTIELDLSCPTTINTYDPVIIYEEGVKVLTGFVSLISKSAPEAKITVRGQDTFVKATDFFIPEAYTTDFGQTAQYWITFLLNLAGLTPTFTDGEGPYLIAEQEIGLDSVANLVVPILQYAGWYARVDENGIIIVGKIDKTPISEPIRQGIVIIQDGIEQSYDKTRNKAIVFGGVDTTLNRFEHIISVSERDLSFLPVDQTVVIGNPYIADQDSADDFSAALVNEFARPTQIKTLTILANPIYQAGKFVEIFSDLFTGIALISSLKSDFSDQGYTMDLILDDLCPRVVGAIKHQPELYAGTLGDGVWAYNMYSGAWEDISAGLTNFYINDLSVDNGLFIAATPAGIYTKLASDPWVKQNVPLYSGSEGATLVYSGVYANLFDTQVHAIVTAVREDYNYAWFYTGTIASGGTGFRWSGSPIYDIDGAVTSGRYYSATDVEGNYSTKFITTRYQLDNRADVTYYTVSGVHIYSMGLYGENKTPVFQSGGSEIYEQPSISHDGSRLVFASNVETPLHNDIYVSNLDGTNARRLTNTGFGGYYPSWSFDDSRIVFVREFALDAEIYTMNADGTEQTQVTNGTSSYYKHPRFIDTHKIAYSKVTDPGFYNIYVIDDDGTNELQITNNAFDTEIYNYDTGQLRALYISNDGGSFDEIYSIGTDGNNNELIKSGSDVSAPNLTSDGKFLIFSQNGKVYIAGLVYLNNTKITDRPLGDDVQSQGFGKLLDSKIIYNVGDDIYNINLDGTGETLISLDAGSINFFGNKQGFWVLDTGATNTFYISTDGVTLTEVSTSEDMTKEILSSVSQGHGWGVSYDGSKVIISRENDTLLSPPIKDYDFYEFSSAGVLTRLTNDQSNGSSVAKGYSINGLLAYNFDGDVVIHNVGSFEGTFRTWSTTSDTLFYIKTGTSPQEIWSYSAEAGHSKVYTCSTGRTVESIKISPNGEFMAVEEFKSSIDSNILYVSVIGSNTKSSQTVTQSNQSYDLEWTEDSDSLIFRGSIVGSIENLYVRSVEIELADGTQPFHRTMVFTPKTRVFETFDNQTFYLVFEDRYSYLENNVDTYSPLTVYGTAGNLYATDFTTYSGTIASGLVTFDVAARWEDDVKALYATTGSGIYRTIVSGQPVRKNTVAAREIVTRYYGSGEIFFSVGAEVKESLDACATYADISSGLPGSTITVLRLDK